MNSIQNCPSCSTTLTASQKTPTTSLLIGLMQGLVMLPVFICAASMMALLSLITFLLIFLSNSANYSPKRKSRTSASD